MKNNYYVIAFFYPVIGGEQKTLFGSVREALECQAEGIKNNLFRAASAIEVYFKGGKSSFFYKGEIGFRRSGVYNGNMENYLPFHDKFCEFGPSGCFLKSVN